jgi:hypothetical protein
MVLQDQPIPVWDGHLPMNPSAINQQVKKTKADNKGNWRIVLEPQSAEDHIFICKRKNSLVFNDVMIGESDLFWTIQWSI